MVDIVNLGTPQVANRAFVPLAIEAGIEAVIKSVAGLGTDNRSLLIALKQALADANPPLAAALNTDTLNAVLEYLSTKTSSVVAAKDLPKMLDEEGPASVVAARDGSASGQVNITFSAPSDGYTAEIYVDGVYVKDSKVAAIDGWVNDSVQAESISSVRVLFRNSEGELTKFGPIARLSEGAEPVEEVVLS